MLCLSQLVSLLCLSQLVSLHRQIVHAALDAEQKERTIVVASVWGPLRPPIYAVATRVCLVVRQGSVPVATVGLKEHARAPQRLQVMALLCHSSVCGFF